MVQQLFLYFGMRWFDNFKEVTVSDVRVLDRGDWEVYVRGSKTDQEEKGSVFHMSGERRKEFSIPDVVCWNIDRLGLEVKGYLFPRLKGVGK